MYGNEIPEVAEKGFLNIINAGIPEFNTMHREVILFIYSQILHTGSDYPARLQRINLIYDIYLAGLNNNITPSGFCVCRTVSICYNHGNLSEFTWI